MKSIQGLRLEMGSKGGEEEGDGVEKSGGERSVHDEQQKRED